MAEKRTYIPINIKTPATQLDFGLVQSYKKADLHLHTTWSDGGISPEEMVDTAVSAGMDAIAITDHDVVTSSDLAMNYAQRNNLPIEVVRGVEVSSKNGHVLALNIEGEVKAQMPLTETIKEIHRQKGFAVIAHPGARLLHSVPLDLISEIINSEDPELYFDGIEIFNASAAKAQRIDKSGLFFGNSVANIRKFIARNINNPRLGALFSGSDAHTSQIGYGITVYNTTSVIEAIKTRDTLTLAAKTGFLEDTLETASMTYSILKSHLTKKLKTI